MLFLLGNAHVQTNLNSITSQGIEAGASLNCNRPDEIPLGNNKCMHLSALIKKRATLSECNSAFNFITGALPHRDKENFFSFLLSRDFFIAVGSYFLLSSINVYKREWVLSPGSAFEFSIGFVRA